MGGPGSGRWPRGGVALDLHTLDVREFSGYSEALRRIRHAVERGALASSRARELRILLQGERDAACRAAAIERARDRDRDDDGGEHLDD